MQCFGHRAGPCGNMHAYRAVGGQSALCPELCRPSTCQGRKEKLQRESVVGSLWNVPATFHTRRASRDVVFPVFPWRVLLSDCGGLAGNEKFESCLFGPMSGCDAVVGKLKVPVQTLRGGQDTGWCVALLVMSVESLSLPVKRRMC